MKRAFLVAGAVFFGLSAALQAAGVADLVEIRGAAARAVAPGVPVSGAYLTLDNTDGADHALVAAHSDVAESVELHSHVMDDGMMRMRKLQRVALPADGTVVFEPGGLHIMLIGLKKPMNAGESVDIELEFEDGSRKAVTFDIR